MGKWLDPMMGYFGICPFMSSNLQIATGVAVLMGLPGLKHPAASSD
jgi:hypothetical protein